MKHVDIYSDGAAKGNPGRGGFGALLRFISADGAVYDREISKGFVNTTNNRMELLGVIEALEALKAPCDVTVHTDSQYVVKAFTQRWIENWARQGWMTAARKPVKNVDLWQRLLEAMNGHEVAYVWVKGHDGNPENERCDELATLAADGEELQEDAGYVAGA